MEDLKKNTTDGLKSKFIDPTYDRGFQLLMMNPEVATISEATGLTTEQIESL